VLLALLWLLLSLGVVSAIRSRFVGVKTWN